MHFPEISNRRLTNQCIGSSIHDNVKNLVSSMGAIQAQDFAMAKWAIGIRVAKSTINDINEAFNKGDLIRTHLMRPTWHIVSSNDVHWMLDLTAQRIKSSLRSRHTELGLNSEALNKANRIIEKELGETTFQTREKLALKLNESGIRTDENRLSHILFNAELEKLVCSGPVDKNNQTYTLLNSWVPKTKTLLHDEALAELARRYFSSHGPATLKDFTWWSGLPVGEARKALDYAKDSFISETINSETYWFTEPSTESANTSSSTFLLPAYDEFLISYADRSASILQVDNKKAISNNGIFRPVIVENGQVTGLWKRTIKNKYAIIEFDVWQQPTLQLKEKLEAAALDFGRFLELEIRICWE